MYVISYVFLDSFCKEEYNNKDTANKKYLELLHDPAISELTPSVKTIDIKFPNSEKQYTYFTEEEATDLEEYPYIQVGKKVLKIVRYKTRTVKELKALAKSQGFSFSDYKVLKGTLVKNKE